MSKAASRLASASPFSRSFSWTARCFVPTINCSMRRVFTSNMSVNLHFAARTRRHREMNSSTNSSYVCRARWKLYLARYEFTWGSMWRWNLSKTIWSLNLSSGVVHVHPSEMSLPWLPIHKSKYVTFSFVTFWRKANQISVLGIVEMKGRLLAGLESSRKAMVWRIQTWPSQWVVGYFFYFFFFTLTLLTTCYDIPYESLFQQEHERVIREQEKDMQGHGRKALFRSIRKMATCCVA